MKPDYVARTEGNIKPDDGSGAPAVERFRTRNATIIALFADVADPGAGEGPIVERMQPPEKPSFRLERAKCDGERLSAVTYY